MTLLRITNWEKGANSVKAIKAIREFAHLNLKTALDLVNQVLENKVVDIPMGSESDADRLAAIIGQFGLISQVHSENMSSSFAESANGISHPGKQLATLEL